MNQNILTIIYKGDSDNNIRLFGDEFVQNNMNNCKIIVDDVERQLTAILNISQISYIQILQSNNIDIDIIPIKLRIIGNLTDLSHMFEGTRLKLFPNFQQINTGNVTNMSYMFSHSSIESRLPDALNLTTSSVTNMEHMFDGNYKIPDITAFNMSHVTNIGYMLANLKVSNLPDISHWNTSKFLIWKVYFLNQVT